MTQPVSWAPAYAHSHDLAAWLHLDNGQWTQPELVYAVEAASRAIDKTAGRQFGKVPTPQTRRFTAEWFKDRWVLDIDDLMTTEGLTVEVDNDQDGTPEAEITAYDLTPVNAVARGRPWTTLEVLPRSDMKPNGLRNTVHITAQWGWTKIPREIRLACLMQAARFHERRQNVGGPLNRKRVDDVELGWSSAGTYELDADVATIVAPFRRWWAAA